MTTLEEDFDLSAASVGQSTDVSEVVRSLEGELARAKRRRWVRVLVLVLVVGGASSLGLAYKKSQEPQPEPQFTTAATEKRDVIEEVQSTGVVEPVNQVEVGAQVSGRIVTVDVDFNDNVTHGQLLAEIDPELLGADVVQQNAQLGAARAAVKSSEARRDAIATRLERLKRLVTERVASAADLDQAQGEYDVSLAEVAASQAQIAQILARLSSARATLTYTKIFSPIDGVVIDRQVEPGQTVASSFNTPVLFVIARDLREMRVLAEIDEADVGKVKEGMLAEVSVDAFAGDRFQGKLTQIRLSPNRVEGVVTYSAVILVDNPDAKLRPGMTATVRIETRKAEGVPAIRNAALRFEPLTRQGKGSPSTMLEEKPLSRLKSGQARVYLEGNGPQQAPGVQAQVVEVGISDGVWTELKGGLTEGARPIVDEKPDESKKGFRLF